MSKLYPPDIGGVIPSFYGKQINIPIIHNRLNSTNDIWGYSLIIKSISNNKLQDQITINKTDEWIQPDQASYGDGSQYYYWDQTTNLPVAANNTIYDSNKKYYLKSTSLTDTISFNWPAYDDTTKEGLKPNMYYKVQVAYIGQDGIGYYSDIAVVRYTTTPTLTAKLNFNEVVGTYHNNDTIEKVYQYKFDIYKRINNDESEKIISSDWLLHNNANDTSSDSSSDTWILPNSLQIIDENIYTCKYSIRTINEMEIESQESEAFQVTLQKLKPTELNGIIIPNISVASINYHSGKKITLNNHDGYKDLLPTYTLYRTCSKDDYASQIKLYDISDTTNTIQWYDYSIEHGYLYKYQVQISYTENGQSKLSEFIESDNPRALYTFEDMYLADNERQLRIGFNPKVSSFKITTLETKTDTIGSKYPFFFRNGNTGYREFPISGLISHIADEQETFLSKSKMKLSAATSAKRSDEAAAADIDEGGFYTNLTHQNILAERIFKTEVLEWLNNGKPKLFRSPTEGNFIVRLMNVSLSPNDTLGRMLHTFSATAYEIAECTPENLEKYNIFYRG